MQLDSDAGTEALVDFGVTENWEAQVFDLSEERSKRQASWDDDEDEETLEEYAERHRRGDLYSTDHLDDLVRAEFHPTDEDGVWERRFGDAGESHQIARAPGVRVNGKLTPWYFSTGEGSIAQPHPTLRSAIRAADAHRAEMLKMASAFPNWTVYLGRS